jgi:hypothetical protein
MDPRHAEYPPGPEPDVLRLASYARDGVIEIIDGHAQLSLQRREHLCGFLFQAIVKARVPWLRFDALEVVLRDGRGAPLLAAVRAKEQYLRPAGRLGVDGHLVPAKLDDLRRVEVRAVLRQPFQVLAGRWLLGRLPDARGGCALERTAASDLVHVGATAYVTRERITEVDVVAELGLAQPGITATHCRAAIALRGEQGAILDGARDDVTLPADGSTVIVRRLLGLDAAKLRSVKWLDVALRGARTIKTTLATFEV